MLKLEFGSGDCPRQGYEHCDLNPDNHVEHVIDLSKNLPFESNSVDEILARSILEHIPHGFKFNPDFPGRKNLVSVLKEWNRILKPGAELHLILPHLEGLLKASENSTISDEEFISYIYGGQSFKHNEHYCGFTKKIITRFLLRAGFSEVKITDPFEWLQGIQDTSWEMHVMARK